MYTNIIIIKPAIYKNIFYKGVPIFGCVYVTVLAHALTISIFQIYVFNEHHCPNVLKISKNEKYLKKKIIIKD